MSRGNSIFVTSNPRGIYMEGVVKAGETIFPGVVVQFDISAGINGNGKFTWELFNADADGGRPKGPLICVIEDRKQGKLMTASYVAGDVIYGYVPLAGEELNMLLGDVAGTGDAHTAGEMLIVDDTTGELIATASTPETEPFMLLETVAAPTADTLAHVIYTGY